jgi:hypothetical protein
MRPARHLTLLLPVLLSCSLSRSGARDPGVDAERPASALPPREASVPGAGPEAEAPASKRAAAEVPEAPMATSPRRDREAVADEAAPAAGLPPSEPGVVPVAPSDGGRRGLGAAKAGAADDNLAYGAFLDFVHQHGDLGRLRDLSERLIVSVRDRDGLPLAGARVVAWRGKEELVARTTYADGRTVLHPSAEPRLGSQDALLEVSLGEARAQVALGARRGHELQVVLDTARALPASVPLDVAFVLDTTGSMGDEIAQLKRTIEAIHFQLTHLLPRPELRFAMVLFKDVGDSYRTEKVPFTRDLEAFEAALARVEASGGGDEPEDVEEALRVTMEELDWRPDGVRLAFLVGDAPPHLDYPQRFTYLSAIDRAAERGIKVTTIGASGLSTQGELIWRQLAQGTMAPFVFLTYGETGDSEGSPSSVSHHVGSNWVADRLDAIVVRMVKVELSHYGPKGAAAPDDFFQATSGSGDPDAVLGDLFQQSVKQLIDYAVQRLDDRTPTVVLPLASPTMDAQVAEKLRSRLLLGLGRARSFQLVEHTQRPELLAALAGQLAESYDADKALEVGKLVPARLAVLGQLEAPAGRPVELLLKLVRLESGEVLSLSLLKIDRALLL